MDGLHTTSGSSSCSDQRTLPASDGTDGVASTGDDVVTSTGDMVGALVCVSGDGVAAVYSSFDDHHHNAREGIGPRPAKQQKTGQGKAINGVWEGICGRGFEKAANHFPTPGRHGCDTWPLTCRVEVKIPPTNLPRIFCTLSRPLESRLYHGRLPIFIRDNQS